MSKTTGKLILKAHEPRHYLLGRDVHCGDQLELQNGSEWIPVRYEAHVDSEGRLVAFFYCKAGMLRPFAEAIYRWPSRRE